jgi:hypothetical protein
MVSAFSVWGEEGKRGRDKEGNMGVGVRSREGRERRKVERSKGEQGWKEKEELWRGGGCRRNRDEKDGWSRR